MVGVDANELHQVLQCSEDNVVEDGFVRVENLAHRPLMTYAKCFRPSLLPAL